MPAAANGERIARHVGLGERQETAQPVVEDQHGILALHLDPTAPGVDLAAQVGGAHQFDQAALLHAAPQRQQRRIQVGHAREQQGDPAPGLRGVDQPRAVPRLALAPVARLAVALHLQLDVGHRRLLEPLYRFSGVQERGFMPRQFGRQAQLHHAGIAQAGRDEHAFGQQPGRAVEHGRHAKLAAVEAGRVDHQHRGAVAAQKLPPGQVDRFAGAAALGQARRLHPLQTLRWRQSLGLGEARQRGVQGLRRRRCARQGCRARVEPRRQQQKVAHFAPSPPFSGSAISQRA